ncbi:GNAT family N-acetyltransferase [Burkholderia sp. Ac-20365]|jgi:RimJ/RimL family protein N-acetyltransferase|uniref:GNAT family N-acetyltransferase n=1 Tax=Burkholderia sp. Ac-20365 TaxID=2703897 RepID=UPI00197B5760|nr:GNAT family N-acetyltransferase [Burkholderia sp. Ac-20365]MBN3766146.1 GNAT family N-acetyltransferase [Burkholderia sp. Ac-20365]
MPLLKPITLDTSRLILRPLQQDDAASLFAIWSDPLAMRYFSFVPMTSVAQAEERVERRISGTADGASIACTLVSRQTGEALGDLSLFNVNEPCLRAEIGFSLQRRHWGNGYMFEAAARLVDHAFDAFGLRRIEADIDPRNQASANLLERLGFKREGLLRERWRVGDEVSDSALYGLLESERRVPLTSPVAAPFPPATTRH